MAKKTLDFNYAFDKYKEAMDKLSEEEFDTFDKISKYAEKYPSDFFDVKSPKELSGEFGYDVTKNVKQCLSWYRLALAIAEYMQWDVAAERN